MEGDVELVLIVWGLSIVLYGLGTLIPSLAVSIRRLHDIGRSGWWLQIVLIPLVGWIIVLTPGTCLRAKQERIDIGRILS